MNFTKGQLKEVAQAFLLKGINHQKRMEDFYDNVIRKPPVLDIDQEFDDWFYNEFVSTIKEVERGT